MALIHTSGLKTAYRTIKVIVPISMTCFCYRKFHFLIKKSYQVLNSKRKIARKILYSTFLPIICFGPRVIYCILTVLDPDQKISFGVLFPLLWMDLLFQYVWDFFNLWLYWAENNNENHVKARKENSERTALLSGKSSMFLEL